MLGDDPKGCSGDGVSDLGCSSEGAFATLAGELGKGDADVDALALFLGQATPHAIWFTGADAVVSALNSYVTASAHRLGGAISAKPCEAPLVLWMEEKLWIGFPTGSLLLPLPCGIGWYLRQRLLWH